MARENAQRNPRRTSGAAAALMIGVAVVALFTVFAASIKSSIDNQVKKSFAGDLVINSQTRGFGGFNPLLAQDIGKLAEVKAASGIRTGRGEGQRTRIDSSWSSTRRRSRACSTSASSRVRWTSSGSGTTAVSTRYADDHNLKVGDSVPVSYADGSSGQLTIVATFANRDVVGSDFTMSTDEWTPHANENLDSLVVVKLNSGVSLARGPAGSRSR